MSKNQFVVDLGTLTLTDDQRKNLNAAIHKAVAGELLNIANARNVGLFPIDQGSINNGTIINGIIIRDFDNIKFKNLIK